ncbi:MAG: hypothetical protein ACJAQT_002244 [Akkermansiaceae bacterium]|jgi:hypothetical protein
MEALEIEPDYEPARKNRVQNEKLEEGQFLPRPNQKINDPFD